MLRAQEAPEAIAALAEAAFTTLDWIETHPVDDEGVTAEAVTTKYEAALWGLIADLATNDVPAVRQLLGESPNHWSPPLLGHPSTSPR